MTASKAALVLALGACVLGLSSCSMFRPPAGDARAALLEYWDSLPSAPGIEHRIVRAWPGDVAAMSEVPPLDVWCVEAELSAPGDPAIDGALEMWIVTRGKADSSWSVSLLAAMSSTWPYEACGDPG